MKTPTNLLVVLSCVTGAHAATLVGSFQAPTNVDPAPTQTLTTVTRTSDGNLDTQGAVGGVITIAAGQEIGNPADFTGIDLNTFAAVTQFNNLNRYGSNTNGGLIIWDFDLSTYLQGKTVGNAAGNSQFSLVVDFTNRRTSDGYDGLWFISYTGGGLTLDTTDVTTHPVGGNSSGVANGALVGTSTLYQAVLSLPANAGAGLHSVDLTPDLATVAAGDGKIRIAYLEREFQGDIRLQNGSGLVEAIAVPEPSASLLGLFAVCGLLRRRR